MMLAPFLFALLDAPPPLTEEQIAKIQTLVRSTQTAMTELRTTLDEKQKRLARLYADFDLDLKEVGKVQAEIVELQRKLLGSYHTLHVELRKIVGRERFSILRQRIDNVLNPPKKEK